MASSKNKTVGKEDKLFNIENSLPTIKKSRRTRRTKVAAAKVSEESHHIITTVVILTMLVVILSVFFAQLSTPERIIKGKIESIATDYYENYFYDRILDSLSGDQTITDALDYYSERGFNRVPLEQLFLFDNQRWQSAESAIVKYCDPAKTSITIYPDSPYGPTDYHIDYAYSCDF